MKELDFEHGYELLPEYETDLDSTTYEDILLLIDQGDYDNERL